MSDTYTDVVGQRGEYRAKITIDTSPNEPENEMGYPILRIDSDGYRVRVDPTEYGVGSAEADGLTSWTADEALARCIWQQGNPTDGVEMFSRWLRIWHGGSAVGYHLGYSREYGYCAYVTEAMVRNGWGGTGPVPEPELSEWEAYCDGEVYWISVERRLLKRTEYVTFDDRHPVDADEAEVWFEEADSVVGGYYGEQWAREAALEALAVYAGPNHEVFYASADGPHPLSTWSVYREEYLSPDDDEPIEGATRRMSTWLNEEMAQAAVVRLQAGEI